MTLRRKRNTPTLHIQYLRDKQLDVLKSHNGHAPVVHTHASTLPTLPIV